MRGILEALIGVLGADAVVLIGLLTHLLPKWNQRILERRELLDEKLKAKISESKTSEIIIEAFLPLFEEYETIEEWRKTQRLILVYLGFSMLLTVVGLFFYVFDSIITLAGIPVEVIFLIGGGLYLLVGVGLTMIHAIHVGEWKASKRR